MAAVAHQAYRAAEYDEAIIALEESLALRLFAYTDQKTLDRWQQGLVMPGTQYRHDKKAIADSLVLRSDCLVQLARVSLWVGLECIQDCGVLNMHTGFGLLCLALCNVCSTHCVVNAASSDVNSCCFEQQAAAAGAQPRQVKQQQDKAVLGACLIWILPLLLLVWVWCALMNPGATAAAAALCLLGCWLQANHDVAELTEATELLQLATAELQAGQALLPDNTAAISSRISAIAALASELLPRLHPMRLLELLEQHGASCTVPVTASSSGNATSPHQLPAWCESTGEMMLHLVPLLRLPVCLVGPKGRLLVSSLGCGSSQQSQQQQGSSQQQEQQLQQLRRGQFPGVQPVSDPFGSFGTALLQKPCEVVAHYLQRMFFRLLSVVPVEYMRDLRVPCHRTDSRGRCISYLPTWVTAQAVTIDARTGRAHVSGPSTCAGGSDSVACTPAQGDSNRGGPAVCSSCSGGTQSSVSCACAGSSAASSSSRCQSTATGGSSGQQQQGGLQLCGFLHIRSLPPGVDLPAGGLLSPEQQAMLQQAAEAATAQGGGHLPAHAACAAADTACSSSGANPGVYYYYFPDIPAVLDQVVHTQVSFGGFESLCGRQFGRESDAKMQGFESWQWVCMGGLFAEYVCNWGMVGNVCTSSWQPYYISCTE